MEKVLFLDDVVSDALVAARRRLIVVFPTGWLERSLLNFGQLRLRLERFEQPQQREITRVPLRWCMFGFSFIWFLFTKVKA